MTVANEKLGKMTMELEFGAYTIKGKKDGANQDHHRLLADTVPLVRNAARGQLFGVFDGMGSTPRAADAAWHVGQNIIGFFKAPSPPCPAQITELLSQANQEICAWGFVDTGLTRHLGACAGTVAWLFKGILWIFHAGDTQAMLLKAGDREDEYVPLTTDHAEGHVLYRYFGLGAGLEMEQRSTPVTEGDILVLMTDGVTMALLSKEIASQVRGWVSCQSGSADHAARKLCELARERGSRDDITAVVVEIVDIGNSDRA